MPFLPFQILGMWFRGLLALALLGLGAWLVWDWVEHPPTRVVIEQAAPRDGEPDRPADREGPREVVVVDRTLRLDGPTARLLGGVALLAFSLGAGLLGSLAWSKFRAGSSSSDATGSAVDDPPAPPKGETMRLKMPNGAEIHVELYGPEDAPVAVLTHGWGTDRREWTYVLHRLARDHRLIAWDIPGLGESKRPDDHDYRLETLAAYLDTVIGLAGDRPATLVGHSIGGMIQLTYARLYHHALGTRVAGLALVHTTYTNPVRTADKAALYTALQKPVIEPLLHLTIWLSPLVWLMNALSYLNGSAHRSSERTGFSGRESWAKLDRIARYTPMFSPAVLARGMLGMLRYDASAVLESIPVPTLVVAGDQDPLTAPTASETMTRAIPRATAVTLAPAKHMGHFEHPTRFVEALATLIPAGSGVASA